jgi:hypothetical protein
MVIAFIQIYGENQEKKQSKDLKSVQFGHKSPCKVGNKEDVVAKESSPTKNKLHIWGTIGKMT